MFRKSSGLRYFSYTGVPTDPEEAHIQDLTAKTHATLFDDDDHPVRRSVSEPARKKNFHLDFDKEDIDGKAERRTNIAAIENQVQEVGEAIADVVCDLAEKAEEYVIKADKVVSEALDNAVTAVLVATAEPLAASSGYAAIGENDVDLPGRSSPTMEQKQQQICTECGSSFGWFRFRYTCGKCMDSFCSDCLQRKHITRSNEQEPKFICEECYYECCATLCNGRCLARQTEPELLEYMKKHEIPRHDLTGISEMVTRICKAAKRAAIAGRDTMENPLVPQKDAPNLAHLTIKGLKQFLDTLGIDHSACTDKDELLEMAYAGLQAEKELLSK
eukprot:Colp12_sorted_trinity150504_noHs@10116